MVNKELDDEANEYANKRGYPHAELASVLHAAYIAGATQSSTVKELREENEILKSAFNRADDLINGQINALENKNKELDREVERLKELAIGMFRYTPRYNACGSPATQIDEIRKFKTENNL